MSLLESRVAIVTGGGRGVGRGEALALAKAGAAVAVLGTTRDSGFMGTWNLMQACFPIMKVQSHGRIINTCSNVGYSNWPGFSGYAATKEAIRALTRTTATEWGAHGITVNVLSPASLGPSMAETFSDETRDMMMAQIPMRRFGDAEQDIGRAVVYLAGDGGYVTGCTLSVDGGMQMVV